MSTTPDALSNEPDPDDALCPGCKAPASSLPIAGWLFHCRPCDLGCGCRSQAPRPVPEEYAAVMRLLQRLRKEKT